MFSQNLNCIRNQFPVCYCSIGSFALSTSFMISLYTQAVHGQIYFCCYKQSICKFYLSGILDILCAILMRKGNDLEEKKL